MSGIQQFNIEESLPVLTDRDLRRRWAQFHGSIRMVSGNRLQRGIGRLLGDDTWRYRAARVMGRPLLRLYRAATGRQKRVVPRDARVVAPVDPDLAFPINYQPQPLATLKISFEADHRFASVLVVELDDDAPPAQASDQLNDALAATDATWILVLDRSATPTERVATTRLLLDHARDEDDVVFADETGPNPATPILKSPAVGTHTLLSYDVVGRPALIRVSRLRAVGGFATDAGRAVEHDAYLRLSEDGATFRHVALVLPGGRGPRAFDPAQINDATVRVVEAALARRGWSGRVVADDEVAGLVHWRLDPPTPAPSIDIVIPTRDRLDLVRRCLDAIETTTTYPNYDIIILDNDSKEPETLDFFATTRYRVVACPGPFNYAHIVNRGVSHSNAQYVVTLNNDTIVITPDWLERLVALCALPDVGIVGGCLIDQNGRREHESIVISPYPQHLRTDSNYPHRDQFSRATRDVAAVTGAVQMVAREFWEELGGMDETLKVVMNDVDICLRAQVRGRHVVYTPDVQLYHHVSSSRGTLDPLDDRNRFIRRWDIFGSFRDPYFPESLLLLGETMYYRYR